MEQAQGGPLGRRKEKTAEHGFLESSYNMSGVEPRRVSGRRTSSQGVLVTATAEPHLRSS